MSALPSPNTQDQRQQQPHGQGKDRPAQTDPPSNPDSTSAQRPQDQSRPKASRSTSPGRRTRFGKENLPSIEKEKPATSFLDRFKAEQAEQLQQEKLQKRRGPSVSTSPSRARRKPSSDKGKSSLPVKAKPTVSFLIPSTESGKGRQKQLPKTSRSSSPGRENAKPITDDPSSPPKTRASSLSPSAVVRQRQQKQPNRPKPPEAKENKSSERYPTRPKSPSPERRKAKAAKKNPQSKGHGLHTPYVTNHPRDEYYKTKSNQRDTNSIKVTGPIVQQPYEIKSIDRRKPPTAGPNSTRKQSPTNVLYMQVLLKEKELEMKSQKEEVQTLNRKINQLEEIIATRRHQDKANKKRNSNMALAVDDVREQLNQSKSEHQLELGRFEKLNRRTTAELEKQTALVKSMNKELVKTESKMEKQRRLAETQAREIEEKESWIESLQAQLQKQSKPGGPHQYDRRIMAELQKQVTRVKIMKEGMKEYKRRWNEQRQFSDMQSQQIMEKQAMMDSLAAKLKSVYHQALELEQGRKRDQLGIVARNRAIAASQAQLEGLHRKHKQALEKIWGLESELKEQVQDWNEMEENMAQAQAQMAWMSENLYPDDKYQEHLTNIAIRDLIESRPDGQAQKRINQLESELEEQEQDWIQFEQELDVAQAKVASMGQQSKKLSDYVLPDTPRASVNDHLNRMAKKMMNTRNQLEAVTQRRLIHSQRREPSMLKNVGQRRIEAT
ncbi:MAG: hypothetical protein SGBAC_006090 [Bacillariaceae sp.]